MKKVGKKGGNGGKIRKRKKTKKNQAEIPHFTSTIQMVLNSPLSWTLTAVQKKGSRVKLSPKHSRRAENVKKAKSCKSEFCA